MPSARSRGHRSSLALLPAGAAVVTKNRRSRRPCVTAGGVLHVSPPPHLHPPRRRPRHSLPARVRPRCDSRSPWPPRAAWGDQERGSGSSASLAGGQAGAASPFGRTLRHAVKARVKHFRFPCGRSGRGRISLRPHLATRGEGPRQTLPLPLRAVRPEPHPLWPHLATRGEDPRQALPLFLRAVKAGAASPFGRTLRHVVKASGGRCAPEISVYWWLWAVGPRSRAPSGGPLAPGNGHGFGGTAGSSARLFFRGWVGCVWCAWLSPSPSPGRSRADHRQGRQLWSRRLRFRRWWRPCR
ncbi:hypothetical protein J2S41_001880 [Catenuloplanes atrovinosus]|uniref:Uncharacterized protein n=1 Tax=Catenuloplanes atrovinosus TaxID=137266 RepID=A0AAE3YM81_9ACTN|nr:hypothetical protein [Catenuloplanes atrovinosus]